MDDEATLGNEFRFALGRDERLDDYVREQLRESNLRHLPSSAADDEPVPVEIYGVDETGTVIAGLTGKTVWDWLEIGVVWVDERQRRRGIGRGLMRLAEQEALRRGCTHARLSTFDFQAPGFYERLGYLRYGRLDDYPPGTTVHYLRRWTGRSSRPLSSHIHRYTWRRWPSGWRRGLLPQPPEPRPCETAGGFALLRSDPVLHSLRLPRFPSDYARLEE